MGTETLQLINGPTGSLYVSPLTHHTPSAGGNGGRSGGQGPWGFGGYSSDSSKPQGLYMVGLAALMLTIAAPAAVAHAAAAPAPVVVCGGGYFSVAGFSKAAPKVCCAPAIPWRAFLML